MLCITDEASFSVIGADDRENIGMTMRKVVTIRLASVTFNVVYT